MNSPMSQKQILIKLMIVIPYFRWNAKRKAFGTNAQPRIARYGSSRGLGTSPTRKIPMQPGKLHRYFCLCIYKGPARQFVIRISIAPETPYKHQHFFLHKPLHLPQYSVGNMYHSQTVRFDNR